jgi:hypothetical protein
MKQQIFIIAGALIVLFLILVWAYLLFFGTPQTANDVFAELGLSGSEDTTYIPPVIVEEELPDAEIEKQKLRQLTTKPVAGFREINLGTSTPTRVVYVEKGTGHVFSINPNTGEEVRVSGTTVAEASEAAISVGGDFVAISTTGNTKSKTMVVGEISTTSESLNERLTETVANFSIGTTDEVLYSTLSSSGLSAKAYNMGTGKTKDVFTLPFHEAAIVWGRGSSETHFAYPKASYALEGYLYEITNGLPKRLPLAGFGFSAKANTDIIVYNTTLNQTPTTHIYNRTTGEKRDLDAPILLEKCFFPTTGLIFVCGFEAIKMPYESPDFWYRGDVSFKDSLLAISAKDFVSEELVNTFSESGREIDVFELKAGTSGTALYFTNKNDNTLWMYEI